MAPSFSLYFQTPSSDRMHYCTIDQLPSSTLCPTGLRRDSSYFTVHKHGTMHATSFLLHIRNLPGMQPGSLEGNGAVLSGWNFHRKSTFEKFPLRRLSARVEANKWRDYRASCSPAPVLRETNQRICARLQEEVPPRA